MRLSDSIQEKNVSIPPMARILDCNISDQTSRLFPLRFSNADYLISSSVADGTDVLPILPLDVASTSFDLKVDLKSQGREKHLSRDDDDDHRKDGNKKNDGNDEGKRLNESKPHNAPSSQPVPVDKVPPSCRRPSYKQTVNSMARSVLPYKYIEPPSTPSMTAPPTAILSRSPSLALSSVTMNAIVPKPVCPGQQSSTAAPTGMPTSKTSSSQSSVLSVSRSDEPSGVPSESPSSGPAASPSSVSSVSPTSSNADSTTPNSPLDREEAISLPPARSPSRLLMPVTPLVIGLVIFPDLTQLDLTGPFELLSRLPGTDVQLVAATMNPVRSETGLGLLPTHTFATASPPAVLFVPGGPGVGAAMQDVELLTWLRQHGPQAQWVTAVCTGSLVLASAGLLDGYRATTHWLSLPLLSLFPRVQAVAGERVVMDRNRLTGGGVTAGLDFGLRLVAELAGLDAACEMQLMLEYDPAPPFNSGSPVTADPALVERVTAARQAVQQQRRQVIERIITQSL